MTQQDRNDFSKMGRGYQEKVAQALLQDLMFAEQMADVLDPSYFSLSYLETVVGKFYSYKTKYNAFPSLDLILTMIKEDETDDATMALALEFAEKVRLEPLNGDIQWIIESSLEFCRRQAIVGAIRATLDKVEEKDFDSIAKIMRDALEKGAPRDIGHVYSEGLNDRLKKTVRQPIPTGWGPIDEALNGGLERGTLSTIIAPTGAGKSMFLTNIACSGIESGYDVLYCTLEMADYKIGLRADSYFSGVKINDLPNNADTVIAAQQKKVKGRLIIKEWPTKQASVQTIRAHLQRLESIRGFKPTILIVDYADLLRGTRYTNGEKRHELEATYEELRGLAQEMRIAVVTADQTNRAGLNEDVVTLSSIAEAYAKATVCDVIITISRKLEDKQRKMGRMFIAKSRLGADGIVFSFLFDPSTVKAHILKQGEDPMQAMMDSRQDAQKALADAYQKHERSRKK
jgi:KaiC/GvpD/RAD55 family RecA-like ATPase